MAKTYKGIVLEIGGDASGLNKELKKSETQSKSLQTQLNNVNKALKLDPGNVDLVKQKQRLLAEQVVQTEDKLKILKTTQEEFIRSGGDITDAGYVSLQTEIVKTEDKLNSLKKSQSGVSAGLEAFGDRANATGDKLISGAKKTAKMSAVAAGALYGMASAAMTFDEAWTGVKKVYQGTDEELDAIKKSVINLSNATGTAATDIAGVAEAGATLGITGDDLSKFTEIMVKLGDTTNVSSDAAADSLGKLMNITKTSASEYENLASAIVNLGNKTAASEDDIIAISQRFASAGTQAGMTEADIVGLSAAMAAVGIDGEAAGSSLSRTINKINSSVVGGGKKLTIFSKTAGMSASDFKRAWEEDAGGAFEKVIIGMNQASAEGKDLTAILAEMGINSTNDVNAMLSLATSSDVMSQALATSRDGWIENTALAEESGIYYDSVGSKMNQLKQTVTNLASELGMALLPFITAVTDGLKNLVKWFSGLDPNIQTAIVSVIAIIAALSPFLLILGTLAKSISKIIGFVGQVGKVLRFLGSLVTSVFGVIKTAISGLFSLIMAHPIIATVMAIVAIVIFLYTKCEWFRDAVHAIIDAVIGFFKGLATWVGEVVDDIVEFFTKTIPEGFDKFVSYLKETWQKIKQWCADVYDAFVEWIGNAIDAVVGFFLNLPENIGFALGLVLGAIIMGIMTIWKFITVTIPQIIWDILVWFASLPGKIWEFLKTVVVGIKKWASEVKEAVTTWASEMIEGIKIWASQTWETFSTWCTDTYDNFIEWASKVIDDVVTWFTSLPGKIVNAISSAIDGIKTWGSQMIEKGTAAAKQLATDIVTWVASIPGKMLDIGKNIVKGIWDGISGAAGWLGKQIGNFCDGVVKGVKKFFSIFSPSRLMRDEVGNYIAEGIGVGFVGELGSVNRNIAKSLESTVTTIQDALDFEMSKQIAFETMAKQDFSTTLEGFQNTIFGTVQQMLDNVVVQHNFNVDGKPIATELTPLVNRNLSAIATRGNRQ